jgi:hypothetical protein
MSKVYINQTALRLNFDLDEDITGYSSVVINVRKPGGSTTAWTCTVSDASTGSVYFNTFNTTTILDVSRKYYLQPEVTFSDGTKCRGETQTLDVYDAFE